MRRHAELRISFEWESREDYSNGDCNGSGESGRAVSTDFSCSISLG